jgi:CRP/FNR family transcriptional regulator, cyclic AMP receptor protein
MNNSIKHRVVAHPFFRGMKPEHLEIIASCASEATFDPDQVLFREGEPADRLYLVETGHIALEAHEAAEVTTRVQELGGGDVLGWSWLFPPFVWHFQARALERTRVIVLDGAHLLIAAHEQHEFGYQLMKRVAQVVIQRLQATRKQLLGQAHSPAL